MKEKFYYKYMNMNIILIHILNSCKFNVYLFLVWDHFMTEKVIQ